MAERVEIMVVAQDKASQIMRGVSSSFGGLGTAIQSLTGGRILEELTSQFIEFGKESVDATLKYANEVRNLSMISGESTESTSRFLQVLDDYKLSADDAMAATRAMTKQGLTPNLQTLAKLSDEYLSINDAQKRNEFIIKNLGRAGLQWVDVLNKGSDALLAQGDAVNEALILHQKQVDAARENEIAMDNFNDSVMALKISIGNKLIPVMTDSVNEFNDTGRAIEIMKEKGMEWYEIVDHMATNDEAYTGALKQANEERKKATDAMLANGEASGELTQSLQEQEEAVKNLTKANQDELSAIGDLTDKFNDYYEKENDLLQTHDELEAKKQELIALGYSPESEAIKDVNQKLLDNQYAQQMNAQVFEEETNKRILKRAEELLSADGLTTAEKDFLIERGIAMGVYTQEAAARLHEEEQAALAMTEALNSIPPEITTTITTNHVEHWTSMGTPAGGLAGGGDVNIGSLYRVNETGMEYFKPSMTGEVIPLGTSGKGGGGKNITIVYSPLISSADRSEIQNRLLPAIIEGIRKAKADKII